jgi:hypothetical protein
VGGVDQNWNWDNITLNWSTTGTKTVQVNATNANGTSNTITWSITVEVSKNLTLIEGLQFIALPVDEGTLYAGSLCKNTPITLLSRWDRVQQKWENHVCGKQRNNFTMQLGEGYFVNSSSSQNITRRGMDIGLINQTLQVGWNLIRVRTSAFVGQVCKSIGNNCTEMWRRNSTFDGYDENFDKFTPIAPSTNNYTLSVDEGYWVYVNNTTEWEW